MMDLRVALRNPRLPVMAAVLLAVVGWVSALRLVWQNLGSARGVEADNVARAIVDGHGFSFPANAQWLFDHWNASDPELYFPTAWVDPVFTYLLAASHLLFGEQAYTAMFVLDLFGLLLIFYCAYQVARYLAGPWAGVLAVGLIASHPRLLRTLFGEVVVNTALAAAAIMLAALLLVRYVERPTVGRLLAAGLATGFMVLASPSTKFFLVLLPLVVFAARWRSLAGGAVHAGIALLCAAVVLTPWAVRNYVVFDELVLVRNGGGQMSWLGTVGAAETFMPGAAGSPLAAPWRSEGPRDAVFRMLDPEPRRQMRRYQVWSQAAADVPGLDEMNEAQRDRLYMAQSTAFLREHPVISVQMSLAKLQIYATRHGTSGLLTLAFALLGALLALRDPRSWPLTLIIASFSAAFLLIIAFYSRYRGPIEPLMTVLAAIGIALALRLARGELARALVALRLRPRRPSVVSRE